MAEPLKNSFGPGVALRVAEMIEGVFPDFDRSRFLAVALDGYEDLELTPRARQIASALADVLPEDRARAMDIVTNSLPEDGGEAVLAGMEAFAYLPMVFFVADQGLECFEPAMRAQYELTKRFTAEFSIRAYLERYPAKTLSRLAEWARDPNHHVRRLVSEGSRPRLPWAPRLASFQEDPAPVLELLEMLKDDPSEYVRRSVANNLNDISKDHPDLVVQIARRWWKDGGTERRRLIRHALRTLIKGGDPAALDILGYGPNSPVEIRKATVEPDEARIGDKIRIAVELENPTQEEARALVDLRVHFVKSNGSTSPKVFKGSELVLQAGESAAVRKTISLAQHSTRKHYVGEHRIEVMLNGKTCGGPTFLVV